MALDFFTEVAEHLLPPHEPSEKFFRLLLAVLAYLRGGGEVWAAVAVFQFVVGATDGDFAGAAGERANRERSREEIFGVPLSGVDAAGVDENDGERSAPRADPHHGTARGAKISDCPAIGGLVELDSFQETIFKLKRYWADRGAIIQEPYDIEVGAGTMCPETFLRVLGATLIGSLMFSRAGGRRTGGMEKIRTDCTSTSNCR